jgi:hypothetical protein
MRPRLLFVIAAVFALLLAPVPVAQAQQRATAADSVGLVSSLKAPASVMRAGNPNPQTLKVGEDIFPDDVLTTGAGGALGITFDDETTFTLQANASITVDDFVYSKSGGGNKALISVARGTVAFFASQVAKTGDMKINTPTATLGIRGTSGVIDAPDGARPGAQVQVKLYQDVGGATGRIEVFARDTTQSLGVLTQPATGFGIAREAGRFAAVALTLSPQQIAADRGLVQRVFSLQKGVGAKLLNQRILRIPELQQRLNFQKPQGTKLLEKIKPKHLLERKTDQKLDEKKIDLPIDRQIDRSPRFRPQIPSGPGGGLTPRMPSMPNIR